MPNPHTFTGDPKKAGIKAIACLWGTKEKSMLLGTAYDQAISSPLEILTYLQ